MACKEDAGFISGKAGLRFELMSIELLRTRCWIALLHDITTVLRLGDITALALMDHDFKTIIEVKGGARSNSQKLAQMKSLWALGVEADIGEVQLLNGHSMPFARLGLVAETHYRAEVSELLANTLEQPYSYRTVEPGLSFLATSMATDAIGCDFELWRQQSMFVVVDPKLGTHPSNKPTCLTVRDFSSLRRLVREEVGLLCFIDQIEFENLLRTHGLDCKWSNDEPWVIEVSEISAADGPKLRVASHMIERVAVEFMGLGSLVRGFVTCIDYMSGRDISGRADVLITPSCT